MKIENPLMKSGIFGDIERLIKINYDIWTIFETQTGKKRQSRSKPIINALIWYDVGGKFIRLF